MNSVDWNMAGCPSGVPFTVKREFDLELDATEAYMKWLTNGIVRFMEATARIYGGRIVPMDPLIKQLDPSICLFPTEGGEVAIWPADDVLMAGITVMT